MLEIKCTEKGFSSEEKISSELFGQNGNTNVKVVCDQYCYTDAHDLEDAICGFINRFMPAGSKVKTDYVTLNQSSGEDAKGKYIEELEFQVHL